MKGILLRVGCDLTDAGGRWNAPVDPATWNYAYVPIPGSEDEVKHIQCNLPTFHLFEASVARLGARLPPQLHASRLVHLDPDFKTLSYGDRGGGPRGSRMWELEAGDFIAFYASLAPLTTFSSPYAYCLIGWFTIDRKCRVKDLNDESRTLCAHGRQDGYPDDVVFWGNPKTSGRFSKAIHIGEFRNAAYRVRKELLEEWGGLDVNDGYIQRSARPPFFSKPSVFLKWLNQRMNVDGIALLHEN